MLLTPPLDLSLTQLADALTHCFEGYILPAHFTPALVASMIRIDGIDLASSVVARNENDIVGVALIARRGKACRVAAMAVAKSARRHGVGKSILAKAIEDAKARNETEMFLEVIEQNPPAIELYKQVGFKIQHRLLGFEMMLADPNAVDQPTLIGKAEKPAKKKPASALKDSTFPEIAGALRKRGPLATSWSIAPASIEQLSGPSRPTKCGEVLAVITPTGEDTIVGRAIAFAKEPLADAIKAWISAMANDFPGKKLFIPAFFPEPEYKDAMCGAGLSIADISQFQMSLELT
jgi:ribosomal protein S18 acetylase RimI-like enzyme